MPECGGRLNESLLSLSFSLCVCRQGALATSLQAQSIHRTLTSAYHHTLFPSLLFYYSIFLSGRIFISFRALFSLTTVFLFSVWGNFFPLQICPGSPLPSYIRPHSHQLLRACLILLFTPSQPLHSSSSSSSSPQCSAISINSRCRLMALWLWSGTAAECRSIRNRNDEHSWTCSLDANGWAEEKTTFDQVGFLFGWNFKDLKRTHWLKSKLNILCDRWKRTQWNSVSIMLTKVLFWSVLNSNWQGSVQIGTHRSWWKYHNGGFRRCYHRDQCHLKAFSVSFVKICELLSVHSLVNWIDKFHW